VKLARREKYLLSLASGAIALFILFELVIFPFLGKRERLQQGIEAKEKSLREVSVLRAEYETYKKGSSGVKEFLARREKGFTLFSFLEKAAGEADVKKNIKYMKPSASKGTGVHKESMVEMKLEDVTMKQLVGYLYRIESPENVISIKRMSINQNKGEKGHMDAVLQVVTLE
jgi:general secretion pathway protein M